MARMQGSTRKMSDGKDKGFAPPFRGQPRVGDGQNINIPSDAMGYAVNIQEVDVPLRTKGNANYSGAFRDLVGNDGAALKGRNGFSDGSGGGAGIGRDSGLDEKSEDPGEEPSEADDELD